MTQLVMIGALVTLAASPMNKDLKSMEDIVRAISPAFGTFWAKAGDIYASTYTDIILTYLCYI